MAAALRQARRQSARDPSGSVSRIFRSSSVGSLSISGAGWTSWPTCVQAIGTLECVEFTFDDGNEFLSK